MQFVPIAKARGIKFDEPIFGKAADGLYHQIRLVSKQETATGTQYVWDFAKFEGNGTGTGAEIIAVAIPDRVKKAAEPADQINAPDPANTDNLAFNG